ncbi:MAG: formate dehydrogenase subunit delta [Pseudomonadota bacterium]
MEVLERHIYMANQIARNLQHEPDPPTAAADHIKLFWNARMLDMMYAHLDAGGDGLDAPAREALNQVRAS